MKRGLPWLVILVLITSCSTSKFNYDNAYQFDTHRYQLNQKVDNLSYLNRSDPALFTSIKPTLTTPIWQVPVAVSGQLAQTPLTQALQNEEVDLSEKGKKYRRKEFRRGLRQAAKDYRKQKREADRSGKALDKWTYTGVVIGGAGLLLLILDVASPLGAIALVVGLGFIVYSLLKKGGNI